ncbi:MAG: NUDIX domain-containing protein [Actinomycetales bacterium]|nr:NUDIX domain-containing protein [Actinomycetales bacterium]
MQPGQHRETARILLHDGGTDVFLLLTHFDPEVELPPRWITPGGGIDDGETVLEAAVRELREETGLIVQPESLGEIVWKTSGRWDWGDGVNHHTYTDYFYQLDITLFDGANAAQKGLSKSNFTLDDSSWTADERRDVIEHRWWNIADLVETDDVVGPHGLASWLRSWLS